MEAARARLAELERAAAWPAERTTVEARGRRTSKRAIDLRALVEGARADEGALRFTLVRQRDAWARPAEFLRLLGLEEPDLLSRLVRTGAEYEGTEEPTGALPAPEP